MNKQLTIQDILTSHLTEKKMYMSQFANKANINRGTISKILNSDYDSLLSIDQLDSITQALGYQKGALYDVFIADYKAYKFDWRRTRSVLKRFAEESRIDLIQTITDSFTSKPNLVIQVSEFADELYDLKLFDAAEVMYNTILRIEKKTASKRMSMSYYRIFKIHQYYKDNNHIYAVQLKPYLKKLDLHYQLDALISLAHVYVIREEWDYVKPFALELLSLSQKLYESKVWLNDNFFPFRPLAYYWGQSFLILGAMYEERGKYDKALDCIEKYSDMHWMDGLDADGKHEVEKLSQWAKDNKLLIEIKTGNQNAIPAYINNLNSFKSTSRNSHIIDGLTTLIEAARKYKYSIDEILKHFSSFMSSQSTLDQQLDPKSINNPFAQRNEARFAYQYSLYLFDRNRYNDGVEQCLRCMTINKLLDNQKGILDAIIIFETYREYVSDEQLAKFSKFIKLIKG